MTIQAFRLLRFLKSVQISEMNLVYLDYENQKAETITAESHKEVQKAMKKYYHFLTPTLEFLANDGFIKIVHPDNYHIIQVLHPGWHYIQSLMNQLLKFIAKSVIVPILVAFFTTLITLWLQNKFDWFR